jgi:hypothetical protein
MYFRSLGRYEKKIKEFQGKKMIGSPKSRWIFQSASVLSSEGKHTFFPSQILPVLSSSFSSTNQIHLNTTQVLIFSSDTHLLLVPGVHLTTHWYLVDGAQLFLYAEKSSVVLRISSLTLDKGCNLHILPFPGHTITMEWYSLPKEGPFDSTTFGDGSQEFLLYEEWKTIQTAKYIADDATYRLRRFIRQHALKRNTLGDVTKSIPFENSQFSTFQTWENLLLVWDNKIGLEKRIVSFLSFLFIDQSS